MAFKNLIAKRLGFFVNDNIQKTHMDCNDGWMLKLKLLLPRCKQTL